MGWNTFTWLQTMRGGLELVPAESHKLNDGGSIPSLAPNKAPWCYRLCLSRFRVGATTLQGYALSILKLRRSFLFQVSTPGERVPLLTEIEVSSSLTLGANFKIITTRGNFILGFFVGVSEWLCECLQSTSMSVRIRPPTPIQEVIMDVFVDFGKASEPSPKVYEGFIITDEAALKIADKTKSLSAYKDHIRIAVKGSGCNGMSYVLEFIKEPDHLDLWFYNNDITILVDYKSIQYIDGSTIDYEVQDFNEGFRFINPNEKASCGCGESFSI